MRKLLRQAEGSGCAILGGMGAVSRCVTYETQSASDLLHQGEGSGRAIFGGHSLSMYECMNV